MSTCFSNYDSYDTDEDSFIDDDFLNKSKFKSDDDAIFSIMENLLEAPQLNKQDLAEAIAYLAESRNFDAYKDTSAEDIDLYCRNQMQHTIGVFQKDFNEIQKLMLKSITSLEKEIYGNEEINSFAIDSSLSNLAYHCKHYRTSNRNLNIKRKNVQ